MDDGHIRDQNSVGRSWSSDPSTNPKYAYRMIVSSTSLDPSGAGNALAGVSLRSYNIFTHKKYNICSIAGSSAARSYPVSLVLSGNYFWSSGIASSQNTYGDWWSSWARQDDSVKSYSLDISASRPVPQYTYFKYVGFALRCVNITALPYWL